MLGRIKNKLRKQPAIPTDEELTKRTIEFSKNDILIITPDLCSSDYPNVNRYVYNAIKDLKDNKLKFDCLVVNDYFNSDTYSYEYEGMSILRTSYNQLRNLLLNKKYKKILIFKPVLKYYKVLNAVNLVDTQVIIYPITNDLVRDIDCTSKYLVSESRDIYNYNNMQNFQFVFQNEKQLEFIEAENNIKFNNARIIASGKDEVKLINNFTAKEVISIPVRKKTPLLSISIASYNVEKFIVQIMCNLLRTKHAGDIEVLVVNDGSKDNTVKVVNDFVKKYFKGKGESVIRLIDKENGGHGSTINKGIEVATGKYFKLLDGDDYFVIDQFDKLMDILEKEDSDLVFTEYYEDFAVTGEFKKTNLYSNLIPGHQYKFEELCKPGSELVEWGPLLHTSVYKTKLLKDLNFKIDEHCFYVDNEFNLMGVFVTNTVTFYPLYVYSYYLGRAGQSVSPESYKKNVKQLAKVCLRIIEESEARRSELSSEKMNYIEQHMVINLLYTMYWIISVLYNDSKNFMEFEEELKKYPNYYNNEKYIGRRIKLLRKTKGHFFNIIIKK